MPKTAVVERHFLCKIKEEKNAYLDYVTLRVIRTKQRGVRKQKETFAVMFDMGKSYRLPNRIRRDNGPYDSIEQATHAGMDKLQPYMKSVAFLEYTFEHGVLEVGILLTVGGKNIYWTNEWTLSADAVFEMEDYIFAAYKNVERVVPKSSSTKESTPFPGHNTIWNLD